MLVFISHFQSTTAIDSWMMQHPGKPLTIYEVVRCVRIAHKKALTLSSILHAFKKCGIYPWDADVFTDLDFLPSAVTNLVLLPGILSLEEAQVEI